MRRAFCCGGALLLSAALLLTGCGRDGKITPGGADQEDAVRTLNTHLINNDLAAFARAALPPDLHARLGEAWQAGRTRWPLDELPLATQYPQVLAALSADNARTELMDTFDRELAGAGADLHQAVRLMSVFMVQFLQHQDNNGYSENERAHYSQLVLAAGNWASTAPLSDRERAAQVLELLIPAARKAGLGSDTAFAEAGMDDALHRITPVMAAFKQALALYGLDLNDMLAQMQFQVINQSGDEAQVQMNYRLGEQGISAVIQVEQIEGRWYVSDFLRHVTDALAGPMEQEMPAA